jgi:hypothetical protein
MALPQGSFAAPVVHAQDLVTLTRSRSQWDEDRREERDLEPARWEGSMDAAKDGKILHRPLSRSLSRRQSQPHGDILPTTVKEDEEINMDWAMSEEVG